jgi:DNA-binding NtrC family response regulator
MTQLIDDSDLAPLMEMLDHGRDGDPRWVVSDAGSAGHVTAIARRVEEQARARGFVPIRVSSYLQCRDEQADDLRDRALVLIGGLGDAVGDSRKALVDAAARSQRPHVLLTFRSAGPAGGMQVREARAVYGATPRSAAAIDQHSPEVARHLGRAARAADFGRAGRHAAADRLLREVASALARRHAAVPASRILILLGRLRLERGRSLTADEVFAESIAAAAGDEAAILTGRIWQALARTDAGRLTEAESICRAVILAAGALPDVQTWARAALARVLLWQNRTGEALEAVAIHVDGVPGIDDAPTRAFVLATTIRVLVAAGRLFDAGQRARALLQEVGETAEPVASVIAHIAHLRVLVEVGDLDVAEQAFAHVVEASRRARTPLRLARARIIWHEALRRGGRDREARREVEILNRIERGAPPLLRTAIKHCVEGRDLRCRIGVAPAPAPAGPSLLPLVHLAHEANDDRDAVQRILHWIASELGASRVDLFSADAGPVSTLLTAGSGLATHLGSRVMEAGIDLPVELHNGGREIATPVRLGSRLLSAIVCRWPLDREPPRHAGATMALAAAIAAPRVEALLASAREQARASIAIPDLVGVSGAMADVRRAIERAANAPFAVLIEGESGAGKELVARAVHQLSPRRERRFCDVNCAALPDDLLESELFGHARGAFTGAVAERPGLFEDASDGTLFLDELPDLSPRGQAKLLRVLQQQEVRRIGETFARKIDVRLVTATNRDMKSEVADGRFRQDLLYRLDVIRIRIPPLRERPEDVAVLAEHFWRDAARRVGTTAQLTHGVLSELARYHWPGNVRELQNVIAALAVAAPARGRVQPSLLPAAMTGVTAVTTHRLSEARAQFERRCVEVALARAGGNRSRAARELGLSRQGLLKTMTRLGMLTAEADAACE